MLSDFSRKKQTGIFKSLDTDKNGFIEFPEFSAHARYVKKDRGWSDQDPQWLELLSAKKMAWKKMKAVIDLDDDKVSLEQWLTISEKTENKVRASGIPAEWMCDIFRTLFKAMDLNNDGVITLDEYSLHLKSIGRGDVDPSKAFNKADLNGDGRLTQDELDQLMLDWWTSDDPEAAGNCFFTGHAG